MKSFLFLFMNTMLAFTAHAQKQLDSIYSYQYKNEQWEPTNKKTYTYNNNISSELFWSFDASLQDYIPANKYDFFYDAACNNYLKQRDNYTYTNNVFQKNISIHYDRNANCELEFQRTVRFDGVTTLYYEYLNIDNFGNAQHIKYFRYGVGDSLSLDFEDFFSYGYDNIGRTTLITTNRKRNGVTAPWGTTAYQYTNEGRIKNILFSFYDPISAQIKKSQELDYTYLPDVEILNTYLYNNPTNSQQLVRIDSSFLDSDNDILHVATWAPIGSGFASSFKSDYYYTNTTDNDNDGFEATIDCDDNNASINPNAMEICDDIDNNCDNKIDENLPLFTYYTDHDGDGFGLASESSATCKEVPPSGFVTNSSDCDDNNSSIYPEAQEIPDNGIDEDCNGTDLITSINETTKDNMIIAPNPATDRITVLNPNGSDFDLILFTIDGKEIINLRNPKSVDITYLESGLYIAGIILNNNNNGIKINYQKLLIQH